MSTTSPTAPPHIRAVYREPDGTFHASWPVARFGEVLAIPGGTLWVDVESGDEGLASVEALFRDVFRFHPLAIEDALQDTNSPKLDDWGEYLYSVFKAIRLDPHTFDLEFDELDVFLGKNYLVTCHVGPVAVLTDLRQQIEREEGARLERGPDHLFYLLLDRGVAAFLPAFERLDDALDAVEDEILSRPTPHVLRTITAVKHAAVRLHRVLIAQREVLNRLGRDPHPLIDSRDRVYFRDVYDLLVRLHDISETLRDLIAGSLDMYLSALSNRTNDTVKTLTVVTVLVLPLNFLVGFFGMNFFGDNILLRDARIPHGELFVLLCLIMLLAPYGMWLLGRWRRWF